LWINEAAILVPAESCFAGGKEGANCMISPQMFSAVGVSWLAMRESQGGLSIEQELSATLLVFLARH
jgi:hypothetical protein